MAESPVYIDKTARVTTSIGFLISIIIAVIFAVRFQYESEERDRVIDVRLTRIEGRFQTYIDRNDLTHENLSSMDEEIHKAIESIREHWALKYGEILP